MNEAKENKAKIAISLDNDLLRRVDAVATERDESRSQLINRLVRNGIDDEEKFVKSLANPFVRELTLKLIESPRLMSVIGRLVGEELTEDNLQRMLENAPKLRTMGERLQQEKKSKRAGRTTPKLEGA